ncbi:MAG: hypothetical protein LBT98_02545 [Puniceicoccales bacterium]|jgi:hypothetical protein|nr:hypothetical protein [Puniceicoccales bacterium]
MNISTNNFTNFIPMFPHPNPLTADSRNASAPCNVGAVAPGEIPHLDPATHERTCDILAKFKEENQGGFPGPYGTLLQTKNKYGDNNELLLCLNERGASLKPQLRAKGINTKNFPAAMQERWKFDTDEPLANVKYNYFHLACDVLFLLELLGDGNLSLNNIADSHFLPCALLNGCMPFPCNGCGISLTREEVLKCVEEGDAMDLKAFAFMPPGMYWIFWSAYRIVRNRLEKNPERDPLAPPEPFFNLPPDLRD